MSEQKALSEKEKLHQKNGSLEALLHTLPVGISILGENRVPVYTNTALKTILKLTRKDLSNEEYRGRKYLRADGSEMPPEEFPSTRVFKEGKAIRDVEIGILTKEGEKIWTTVSALPFEHEDWQVVLTMTDMTRQKEFEHALKKQTEKLTERIKELNCLYNIADLVEQPGITLNEIMQGTTNLIPPSWHYPEETSARIRFNGHEFTSENFQTSAHKQHENIHTRGKITGTIEVFLNKKLEEGLPVFFKEEKDLLYAIAERLGRISERFKAEERLIKLATTDALTGLYNRRHFFDLAMHEIARTQRYKNPLSCIMLDIDDFKNINDSHGHLIGDIVLKNMAQRCLQAIREVDIFARYGGDEFIMLLPEADQRRAKQLVERLVNAFRDQPLQVHDQKISISLSLGLASMNGNNDLNLDTLLIRADEALYRAKKNGKDQIAVWEKRF